MSNQDYNKTEPVNSVYPHIYLLIAITIWASTFINIKVVLLHIPANTLAFLRFFIASGAFIPWFFWQGRPRLQSKDYGRVFLCGLAGITLYNFLQNQGLRSAGAIDAAILASMAPIFIAVLALIFLREKISLRQVLGIFTALTGSALVVTNGSFVLGNMPVERLAGDGLILLTGVCWAVYSITLKGLLERYEPTLLLAYSTWIGTLLLLPLALMEPVPDFSNIPLSSWLHVLYLGLAASALSYLLWNKALSQIKAASAGAYLYLIPLVTAIMAAIYLQEKPGLFTLFGGLAVLLGTYLASLPSPATLTSKNPCGLGRGWNRDI